MYFHWTSKYSIGIESIDKQHKPIIDILNDLQKPFEHIDMEVVSEKVLNYTKTHFEFEEGMMRRYGYPEFDVHKAQHVKFINMITAYTGNKDGNSAKSMARMVMIRWFIDHITSDAMDRKLGRFLSQKGAT